MRVGGDERPHDLIEQHALLDRLRPRMRLLFCVRRGMKTHAISFIILLSQLGLPVYCQPILFGFVKDAVGAQPSLRSAKIELPEAT